MLCFKGNLLGIESTRKSRQETVLVIFFLSGKRQYLATELSYGVDHEM